MAMANKALKPGEVPVDVSLEDQRRICAFSRLHKRVFYLTSLQKLLRDDIEKLDDAITEVMISEEGEVLYVFGESFVKLEDNDAVSTHLEEEKAVLEGDLAKVDEELASRKAEQGTLKAELYAKFGSQIYLEAE
ncbi:hypothetical protein STCU_04074 [Strigomonas culicis]|uniref:Prefoldin subunit 4 n=1 Tax=Strigomonas culicis TaxID=28005 RepID=S9UHX6_9TRYP|nr:hypothetical protein STCU_04074 [Strigomonas culicis]|eukprot:EPY30422.1 hypothetical protein STCU_04074 [Strigomonas culicis]